MRRIALLIGLWMALSLISVLVGVFLIFTAYYGLTRTLMEFLRGDTGRGTVGTLSTSQFIGIVTLLAAAVAYVLYYRWAGRNPDAARTGAPPATGG